MNVPDRQVSENARAYAYRVLLNNIVSLELPPGSAISENEVASALSLSRTPIREALLELRKIGLVDIYPQKGSYVSLIDYELVEDSRFMRTVLEAAVLKLACQGISSEYMEKLQENLALEKMCSDPSRAKRLFELDNEFHQLFFESVGKKRLYDLIQPQMVHFDRLRNLSLKSINHQKTIQDHEDILYAVQRQDSELAEILISRHLSRHQLEKSELVKRYPQYFLR